jgi:hypothetical protein
MMGTKIRNFAPLPREVSLEDLVPKDNFYRRLEATLNLSFVKGISSRITTLVQAVRASILWSSSVCNW